MLKQKLFVPLIHIIFIFLYLTATPNWNGADMTMRSGATDDLITANDEENLGAYMNLPFHVKRRLPMYGTTDVNTRDPIDNKTLVLSRPMSSFMLRSPHQKNNGMDGWEYVESGKYLGSSFGEIDLYQRLLSKGTHSIQTFNALYLFSDHLEGKNTYGRMGVLCPIWLCPI